MRGRERSAVASGGPPEEPSRWGQLPEPGEPEPSEPSEPELSKLLTTDEAVFAGLYPDLRRFAAVVGPPETDPDDLVQEAVSRVLRRGSLAGLDNPGAYLRRSIVNLASNERRRLGRWRRAWARSAPSPADRDRPASYPSDVADLLRLPAATRAALWLVDVEGRSFDEVAELLGSTSDAIRARASRARRALRQTITEEEQ